MNERQSIIGFTEAELGFFLAILCIMLWIASTAAARPSQPTPVPKPPPKPVATITVDSAKRLQAKLAQLQHTVDSLNSPIWPSCRSRGVATGPLLSVVALHGGMFRVDAETVSVDGIARETSESRSKADAAKCRHEVALAYLSDLSAAEYDRSRQALLGIGLRPVQSHPLNP